MIEPVCGPIAAFTNLSRDHLDYHGDMAAYAAAKGALFDDGNYVIQAHNDWAQWAAEGGIPFALFFAIMILVLQGEDANLLSLGAVDFGIIVDSAVIMMENIFRHLSLPGRRAIGDRILAAAAEVGPLRRMRSR